MSEKSKHSRSDDENSDDDAFDNFEVTEPLTRRIASILGDYADGPQIARELLQNSEDAGSTKQWYLLDHRSHPSETIFRKGLEEYMGPALLAGNDSSFKEGDFKSLMNLANSGKKGDYEKIGQMGIGFNSVYHMTDCPSFLSQDQLVILEPHAKIFNGRKTKFRGGVKGNFVSNRRGLERYADQIKPFAALDDDLDLSEPYDGTIFRFPLRTKASDISKSAYSAEQARDMLMAFKEEALECLLFLTNVDQISIYERLDGESKPTLLFDIQITNAKEVRAERKRFTDGFKDQLDLKSANQKEKDATLDYSIRPEFKITDENGHVTSEIWQITSMMGSAVEAHRQMKERTEADPTAHRLIPWVGVAAPVDPKIKIKNSRLFCFLPVRSSNLFPVHINGHFAVKQSRREIWTNQDKDLPSKSEARLKAHWNEYMMTELIPKVYARFLENMGFDHSVKYSLWPVPNKSSDESYALMREMPTRVLLHAINEKRKIFFAGPSSSRAMTLENCYIADHVLGRSTLLVDILHRMTSMVVGLPGDIVASLKSVAATLGLQEQILDPARVRKCLLQHVELFSKASSPAAKSHTLEYCFKDQNVGALEGLPLLPMADGTWTKLSRKAKDNRFLVSNQEYEILAFSKTGIIRLNEPAFPYCIIGNSAFHIFLTQGIPPTDFVQKIRESFTTHYKDGTDDFPTNKWLSELWDYLGTHKKLIPKLEGLHLLRIRGNKLAPLDEDDPVLVFDGQVSQTATTLRETLDIMHSQLGCSVLAEGQPGPISLAGDYLTKITNVPGVLSVLYSVPSSRLATLNQKHRKVLSQYIQCRLSSGEQLSQEQVVSLRDLPIFCGYKDAELKSFSMLTRGDGRSWYICSGFSSSDLPWMPSEITLFRQGQDLETVLQKVLKIPTMNEPTYWTRLLPDLPKIAEEEWDKIILAFARKFRSHSDHHSFTSTLQDLAFVRVRGSGQGSRTKRIQPQHVISSCLEKLYMPDEIYFPRGIYAEGPILTMLQTLGMTTIFSEKLAKERILTISRRNGSNASVAQVAKALLRQIQSERLFSQNLSVTIQSCRWIPGSMSSNPHSVRLYMSEECRPIDDRILLGDTMPAVDISYPSLELKKAFGWDQRPPLDKVLLHLTQLMEAGCEESDIKQPQETSLKAIYRDLLGRVHDPRSLATIKKTVGPRKWILVNKKLYATDRVAFSMPSFLAPRSVQIPSIGFNVLFRAVGVPESVEADDLQGMLRELAEQYDEDTPLSEEDALLAVRILDHIATTLPNSGKDDDLSDLLVLTQDSKLCKIDKVVYDDVNASQESADIRTDSDEETYIMVSSKISHHVATKLKITMLSTQYWHAKKDPDFEPWAQQEHIVDRIRNILNDYDPSSIFKEFLQNAEDAGATKCVFKLDERSYGTASILCPEMAACQGPALIIYNDAEFTKDDFHALSMLGVGNKREDSTKIGRHGLGFNSAYHFTDVPSVVSGTHIGFFDPHRAYLPKSRTSKGLVAEGGIRIDFTKLKGPAYSDQMAPYKGLFGCDMESHFKGTIFRFPLRTANRPALPKIESPLGNSSWTIGRIGSIMSEWHQDVKIAILFLKNMKTIELQGGNSPCSVIKSDITKGSVLEEVNDRSTLGTTTASLINIRFSLGNANRSNDQVWLVYQESQFPVSCPRSIVKLAKEYRWTPHRGTAFPLGLQDKTTGALAQGRLFTHLPTPIRTDTIFHLHGGFALLSSRKGLSGGSVSTEDHAAQWNEVLRKTVMPLHLVKAFAVLLEYIISTNPKKSTQDLEAARTKYHSYLPTSAALNKETTLQWSEFWKHTYNHSVFLCRGTGLELVAKSAQESYFMDTYFLVLPQEVQQKVVQVLVSSGKYVCQYPPTYLKGVKDASTSQYNEVTAALVRKCLAGQSNFLTEIKSPEARGAFLQYILEDILNPDIDFYPSISCLAIIPLPNGQWKTPSSTGVTYYTAAAGIRALIKGNDSLVDENLFSTATLQKILGKLVSDGRCGVKEISPEQFTAIFMKENPGPLHNDLTERVWSLLRNYTDLRPFGSLRILRTLWGDLQPLNATKRGLILESYSTPAACEALKGLLKQRDVPIFSASSHHSHPGAPKDRPFSPANVFRELARARGWERSYDFKTDEAATLRTWVMTDKVPQDLQGFVGRFKIWNSHGSYVSLISASGSVFQMAPGNARLSELGRFPTIIDFQGQVMDSTKNQILTRLGSRPSDIRSILSQYVVPALQGQSGDMTGNQKVAYRNILVFLWNTTDDRSSLSSFPLIPGRTGIFTEGRNLLNPDDDLLRSLFNDQDEMFPDETVWAGLRDLHSGGPFGLQTSNDALTVRRCAEALLAKIDRLPVGQRTLSPTVTAATSSPELCGLAVELVKKIYALSTTTLANISGFTNWSDEKWTIVPAELTTDPVQSLRVPLGLPTFMAFSKLRCRDQQVETWTECAYFPSDLEPPARFLVVHPGAINTSTKDFGLHFRALVRDLAPTWTSMNQQLMFKSSLFKLYERFENDVQQADSRIKLVDFFKTNLKNTPFILNGDHLDPTLPESWRTPSQVVLDIEHEMDHEQPVHPKLLVYRNFLVAVGVREIKKVEGHMVEVPPGREFGVMEKRMVESFAKQDSVMGFMDVKFTFSDTSYGPGRTTRSILAHKFILSHTCEYFSRRFTGEWSKFISNDPENPGLTVVDMSRAIETKAAYDIFCGVLYYLYTDKLIPTNGLCTANNATQEGIEESETINSVNKGRAQYLVDLLLAAHLYCLERLKSLIARTLMPPYSSLIDYDTAFDIRRNARDASQVDLIAYCTEFIHKNHSLMGDQVRNEVKKVTSKIRCVKDNIERVNKDIERAEEEAVRGFDNSFENLKSAGEESDDSEGFEVVDESKSEETVGDGDQNSSDTVAQLDIARESRNQENQEVEHLTLAELREKLNELELELSNYEDQLQDFANLST
ncbi:sacsin [Entomortierella parvispora]|uniref:Sacsin n=1 Tax=Entomortierella parvispora TaxID=205924 RepID=A0A9P3H848_9FUNG|nr:sacsin [Entomortierella parvispora]